MLTFMEKYASLSISGEASSRILTFHYSLYHFQIGVNPGCYCFLPPPWGW